MWYLVVLALALLSDAALQIDRTKTAKRFDGIGGLSGGGATSRLLIDYAPGAQQDVLDYLFKPNYGASLHTLKVEIGGDSQSTDGTESSHMHSEQDLDYRRGYEWWLMVEAKKRNPDIKLYGLAWAFPGWVGNGTGSPFTYPNLTATYITNWVKGAKSVYNLDIDYIGIWNERSSNANYVQILKRHLASAGFDKTLIVAKDGGSDVCAEMLADKAYAAAVDIIGLHYPSDYSNYAVCHALKKPFWASEESSSYDDLNGAACWARVITSHWVLSQITASIMWNLVGSYYHGTDWYASSMMTAVEPWSGHYEVNPVIWATAHVTQFTQPGWMYLENGSGSGELPKGGFYATFVDTKTNNFTLTVVKISYDHAPCTRPSLPSFSVEAEDVTFQLAASFGRVTSLVVWRSNFETENGPIFAHEADVAVVNGAFTLSVAVGDFITVSTVTTATKGVRAAPPSQPRFPLPYSDDFQSYPISQEARYFSDQIGAYEIHVESGTKGGDAAAASANLVMRQMVPALPIGWSDHGSRGPQTLIGMREWQDVSVGVRFKLPVGSDASGACVATRIDQMWAYGIVLCVYANRAWNLTLGGPSLSHSVLAFQSGTARTAVGTGTWHTLNLTTVGAQASGALDGNALFTNVHVRDTDTGFAGIGTNAWYHVEYDSFSVREAGPDWIATSPCGPAKTGDVLRTRNCTRNGLMTADEHFTLLSNWLLQHVPSGLCATAASTSRGAQVSLQPCDPSNKRQQFKNDYTRVRNTPMPMYLDSASTMVLGGRLDGSVELTSSAAGGVDWDKWVYFPNTQQLRNQYTSTDDAAGGKLGYPRCLSTCPAH